MRRRLLVMVAVLAVGMSSGTAPAHGDHGGGGGRRGGTLSFGLSGEQVPDGGDPGGRGHFAMLLDPDRDVVCLRGHWRGLAGAVTALHIHRAPPGETGPHHIELLNDERLDGEWNRVEFCVQVAGGQVHAHDHPPPGDGRGEEKEGDGNHPSDPIEEVLDDPAGFYLNVHSTAFPAGAIRGQLDG